LAAAAHSHRLFRAEKEAPPGRIDGQAADRRQTHEGRITAMRIADCGLRIVRLRAAPCGETAAKVMLVLQHCPPESACPWWPAVLPGQLRQRRSSSTQPCEH